MAASDEVDVVLNQSQTGQGQMGGGRGGGEMVKFGNTQAVNTASTFHAVQN